MLTDLFVMVLNSHLPHGTDPEVGLVPRGQGRHQNVSGGQRLLKTNMPM